MAPDRLLMILAGLVTVLLIVVGVARGIAPSRWPILDKAASAFARDLTVEHIPEQGPLEVQRLAHSFNEMQAQVQRSVADRETPVSQRLARSQDTDHEAGLPGGTAGMTPRCVKGFQKDLQELGVMLQGALSTNARCRTFPSPRPGWHWVNCWGN